MTKLLLQFHGDRRDLLEMAAAWTWEHELHAAAERFFPEYRVIRLTAAQLAEAARDAVAFDRVCLGLSEVDVDVGRGLEFLDRNPHSLVVGIGQHTADGLRESALSAMTDDEPSLRLWRSLVRRTRSQLSKQGHKGATVFGPFTGASMHVPSHLHTQGAHEVAASGIAMLAAAGSNVYTFDDLS